MGVRRLAGAVAAAAVALALVGCGPARGVEDAGESSGRIYQSTERLADGRSVTCLVYKSGYAGGLSCDWAGAR
ncbi:hypothetical protein [Microbacterium sp. NPDC091662]|uniref:hypothetical protein n=1 Tax=Microbacterium sp. NPDC091662 TaxID=3364211 RepID=UPI003800A0F6